MKGRLHPRQPLVLKDGVVRFKENPLVVRLLELCEAHGICDLNKLALMRGFSDDDRSQFAQLLGTSVDGYWDLPYMKTRVAKEAGEEAKALLGQEP